MVRMGRHILEWPITMLAGFVRDGYEEDVLDAIDMLHAYEQTDVGLHRVAANRFALRQCTYQQNIAFFAAARKQELGGSYRVLKKLQAIGISLNQVDSFEQTPLFYASREHDLKSIKLLVEAGCSMDHLDKNQHTCLYYAARNPREYCPASEKYKTPEFAQRRIAATELLIRLGCPTDTLDASGKTVAEYCTGVKQLQTLLKADSRTPAKVRGGAHDKVLGSPRPTKRRSLLPNTNVRSSEHEKDSQKGSLAPNTNVRSE